MNTQMTGDRSDNLQLNHKVEKTTLDRKPDGTLSFSLVIPKENVSREHQRILENFVKTAEVKGFRKGKAPKHLVEERLGKQTIYTEILKSLLPGVYSEAVKRLGIAPITSPSIEPQDVQEGQDWHLTVTVAEKPLIELGDYKKAIAGVLSSSKIWVPGKAEDRLDSEAEKKEGSPSGKDPTDEKLAKIFELLLQTAKLTLPEILIEEEVNRQLSRLVADLQKLNLTLEQYLLSLQRSADDLRREYREQAIRNLKLELILNEIAIEEKLSVSESEIDELIKAVGDEKLRQNLNAPAERAAIRSSLRKRKTIDSLLHLT